jgi:hypothetical protein
MDYSNAVYLSIRQRILELLESPEEQFINNFDTPIITYEYINNDYYNNTEINEENAENATNATNNSGITIIEDSSEEEETKSDAENELSSQFVALEVNEDVPPAPITQLSYKDYIRDEVSLQKYKIPELKHIAKSHKLRIGGTKKVLIERIKNYFIDYGYAIQIQKIFRGHIVRKSFSLRGPALRKRKICVNETDGFTLEPLDEISFELFYSYSDANDFVYGFDLLSLITLYKNKGKIINPYTREKFSVNTLCDILMLGRLIKIIFPDKLDEDSKQIIESTYNKSVPARRNAIANTISQRYLQRQQLTTTINNVIHANVNANTNNVNQYTPNNIRLRNTINMDTLNDRQREIFFKLEQTRGLSIHQRIQELFIEIDILGNYTQSSWFSNLDKRDLMRLFRFIYDLWHYRGQMDDETKRNISYLYCPFTNVRMINRYTYDTLSDEQAREACLSVMEHLVYCGVDVEYQKLGTLHVLSALTMVSVHARNNLYWLYESIIY